MRAAVHPLLAILIPFAFILCMDTVLRDAFPKNVFPTRLILPALLLVGIEATAVGNLLRTERAAGIARVRELLGVMTLAYLVVAGIASVKARTVVAGDITFIYPLALVFGQWTFSAVIHARLREREILLTYLLDRQGENLLHALRDASLQASASLKGLKRSAALVTLFQLSIFTLLVVVLLTGGSVKAAGALAVGMHAVFGLLALAAINTFSHDQILLGEGVVVSGRLQTGRLAAALAIVLAGVPLSIIISRDASPLSLSLLAGLFERIASLFPARSIQDPFLSWRRILEMQYAYRQQLASLPPTPIDPMILIFAELVRRAFITAVAGGLYFFLISPFLSEEFLESLSRHKLAAFLLSKLRAFLGLFSGAARKIVLLLRSLFAARRRVMESASASRRTWARAVMERDLPARKRFQAGRMVRAFLQLIRWAERKGVAFHDYETIAEYTRRFTPALPGSETLMATVMEILEEALFSARLVEKEKVSRFFQALREVRQASAAADILTKK